MKNTIAFEVNNRDELKDLLTKLASKGVTWVTGLPIVPGLDSENSKIFPVGDDINFTTAYIFLDEEDNSIEFGTIDDTLPTDLIGSIDDI